MNADIIFTLVVLSSLPACILLFRVIFKKTLTYYLSAYLTICSGVITWLGYFVGAKGIIHLIWGFPLAFLTLIISLFFLNRKITKPLQKINSVMYNIAEGDGDLSQKLDINSDTEIGKISNNFNKFEDKLIDIVKILKNVGTKTFEIGNNLASNSEEVSATAEEIASTINSIMERTGVLTDQIKNTNDFIGELTSHFLKIAGLIVEQSSSVAQSSAAIGEMIASLSNIEKVTAEKKKFTDDMANLAKESELTMEHTINSINEISKSTSSILELIQIINNVAEQTDLLAMNAAIEASHAGDFGKGFSVVADEIRNLAETTASNSRNISSSLNTIIANINDSSGLVKNTNETIQKLIKGIIEISKSMNETLSGIKELTIGSEQITGALTELIKITDDVQSSSKTINLKINSLEKNLNEIASFSLENKTGVSEITLGINEIAKSVVMLSDMTSDNSENLKILETQLSRFRIQ